jgi:hypothetical protein
VLSARAAETDAMIRVGRDPASGVLLMRVGALVALVAGCVVAGLLFWSGRPQRAPAAPAAPAFDQWPRHVAPPVAPPYANPPTSPPYGVLRPPAPPEPPPWHGVPGEPLPPPRPPGR